MYENVDSGDDFYFLISWFFPHEIQITGRRFYLYQVASIARYIRVQNCDLKNLLQDKKKINIRKL